MAEGPLEGTVDLPKIGKVKKAYVFAGVGVVGVLAVIYYRNKKAAASAGTTVATDGTGTDPAGNVGVIDPATGYVEGSPEDLSALSSLSGYSTGTDYSGGGGGGDTSIGGQVDNGPPFTNNAAWAQYVTGYLSNLPNADGANIARVIGAYLAGTQVTPADRDIINEATAYGGPPPVAGTNGYPPSINVGGSVTSPGGGAPATPGNVHVYASGATYVGIGWDAVQGAYGYRIYRNGQHIADVTGTQYTAALLASASAQSFQVAAYNAAGDSAKSAPVNATTAAPTGPPAPVGHLHSTGAGSTYVLISWDPSYGATGYRVYLNNVHIIDVPATSATVPNLHPSTRYTIQVSAYGAKGESARATVTATTTK